MRLLSITALLVLSSLRAPGEGHLIVLVSIDQLRQDYLNRFREDLTAGGFRMFDQRGAVFTNAHFDYASTETGPGHATIATGAYGKTHGIVANAWYDRQAGRSIYCVRDTTAALLGAPGEGRSPRLLIGSTIGDELRIGSAFGSKVIAISFKDRAAILMAGALANGAFWVIDSTVVSSTYYMASLPEWVGRFNAAAHINAYHGALWDRALPEARYAELDRDDAPYESGGSGLGRTFPHRIDGGSPGTITDSYYAALRASPFANALTLDLASEALVAEGLGRRGVTDLLAISLSANDYVGHAFGPHSHEVFDLMVRTDSLLARFWKQLDATVGLEHCTIALTSDHGVAPIPEYISTHVPGAGAHRVDLKNLRAQLDGRLASLSAPESAGSNWIEHVEGDNIYLDRDAIRTAGLSLDAAARNLAEQLGSLDEVAAVYTSRDILHSPASTPLGRRVRNSYFERRSGDLVVVLKPFLLSGTYAAGTSHGSPYPYDSHVPVMLAGRAFRPGVYDATASPADIAPTLAVALGIELPSQHTGRVLQEALLHTDRPPER